MAAEAGGGTLSEIFNRSRRILLKSRDEMEKLERVESSFTGGDFSELSFSINKNIAQIQSLCTDMDLLLRSVIANPQRDLWKRKIVQIDEEVDFLKHSLNKCHARKQQRLSEIREREQLVGRASGGSSHVLKIFDEESQAMQSLHNSSSLLDDSFAVGASILSKYAEQRDRLKQTQRKALDVLNTVGLSNTVLKLIERRHRVDRWVKYTGMVFTVFFLFAFWIWRWSN